MRGQTVTFDGHRLNDRFFVGEVSVGLPEFAPDAEDYPARDGARIKGMRLGTLSVDVQLVAKPVRGEAARAAISDLLTWLDVGGPRRLSLSSDGGLWRLCVPSGAPQVLDDEWGDRVSVSFLQPEPALFGTEREVTVPSGGSVSFVVGGDYPTRPTIYGDEAVRDASSRQWGVRLDDGGFLRACLPTGAASAVEMDCDGRTCTVAGATTAPTLESDWLTLAPGEHTLQMDVGTGAARVTWHERWHR